MDETPLKFAFALPLTTIRPYCSLRFRGPVSRPDPVVQAPASANPSRTVRIVRAAIVNPGNAHEHQ